MKENLFFWLSAQGVEVTGLLGLSIALGFILLTFCLLHLLLHRYLLVRLLAMLAQSRQVWLPTGLQKKLFNRLAYVLQGLVLLGQAEIWLPAGSQSLSVIVMATQLSILLCVLLFLFSLLDAMLSMLVGKSPWFLFSGLGAMTAVLMLVFKDPILGLVAGIQLSANQMLSVGDWLQMDKYGADGEVIDIGLTTVKVSNWDKTITTIPTYALISDSFKNWQGMTESGGRRIKRSVNIDMTSVRFLTQEEILTLKQARLLAPYLSRKEQELSLYNQRLTEALDNPINGRYLTNIGTFRAYLQAYLQAHEQIRKDMTLLVRQLNPTSDGLPLEIYCFTATTAWAEYESIQADIFDHVVAVISQFHLRLHQSPTGYDMHGWRPQSAETPI